MRFVRRFYDRSNRVMRMSSSDPSGQEATCAEMPAPPTPGARAKRYYAWVLVLLYVMAVIPRLRSAHFDEPDVTYGDELRTAGLAEALLAKPDGKIETFHKAPGFPHFLFLTFKPYYWLVKSRYGWESPADVQWWRAKRYWRSINILLGSLIVILGGIIGASAFNMRVGLFTAALCAASGRCAIWFVYLKEEALTTLACTIVIYCAWRILQGAPSRRRWILIAGLASGSAVAFTPTGGAILPFFLLVLLMSPSTFGSDENKPTNWLHRFWVKDVSVYTVAVLATFLLWFPQLFFRPADVWQDVSAMERYQVLNVAGQQAPSIRHVVDVFLKTWKSVFFYRPNTDAYPYHMYLLITCIFVVAPVYAFVRRHKFLLALCVFPWLTFLMLFYQNIFSRYFVNHYFVPAIVALYLLVAYGVCELYDWLAKGIARPTTAQTKALHALLLFILFLWPLGRSYTFSLDSLSTIRGNSELREQRRDIVKSLPVGSRIFVTQIWRQPHLSHSLFEFIYTSSLYRDLCAHYTLDDVIRQGYDYACIMDYDPEKAVEEPPYRKELHERKVLSAHVLPKASSWLDRYAFVPVQPDEGESFHLSLYFREPCGGDFAGVRGFVRPSAWDGAPRTTRTLILKARLYNDSQWFPQFIRWDIAVDYMPVWHGRDTTDVKYVDLSFPIEVHAGSQVRVRVARTDFREEANRGWGGPPSVLKIDGLRVVDPRTSRTVPMNWNYTGVNGGPGPARYAMRTDWFQNDNPAPLLYPGFEGVEPLVHGWRPYRRIEPKEYAKFPAQRFCRKNARIAKAERLGPDGSDALRFIVELPPKESSTLGIMQPIARPASQKVRKIRVYYKSDGIESNSGDLKLELSATALGLGGVYVDRAKVSAPVNDPSDRWEILELDVEKTWKRKHTRVDLMEFLEVVIEFNGGAGAVFNYLVDNVELDLAE